MNKTFEPPKRKKLGVAQKPRPWCHHDFLESLKGEKVTITMTDGEIIRNAVLHKYDRYTIVVDSVLIFKSAICGIHKSDA